MRRLLYVPIIHSEEDMGSLGTEVGKRSASATEEKRWARHREVVSRFWETIADYLARQNGTVAVIYQDGLAAEGALAKKIVDKAAQQGSKNYEIVQRLMAQGADVKQTEDAALLLEEYAQLQQLIQPKPVAEKLQDYARYQRRKERLTAARDQFIARQINESLKPDQTGVLFLGAYHNVLPYLDKDIEVQSVKRQEEIAAYFQELVSGRDEARFEQLARNLESPVRVQA